MAYQPKHSAGNAIKTFCSCNSATYKLLRTVIQGIIGVIVAYAAEIIGLIPNLDPVAAGVIVAAVMAILSPIMAALGNDTSNESETEAAE